MAEPEEQHLALTMIDRRLVAERLDKLAEAIDQGRPRAELQTLLHRLRVVCCHDQ